MTDDLHRVDAFYAAQTLWLKRLATGMACPPATHPHLHQTGNWLALRTPASGVLVASDDAADPAHLDLALEWLRAETIGDVLVWSKQPDQALDALLRARGGQASFTPWWMWRDLAADRNIAPAGAAIREASIDDVDRLIGSGIPYANRYQLEPVRSMLKDRDASADVVMLLAEVDGAPVGAAIVSLGGPCAGVFNVGVVSSLQHHGIGTALMQALHAVAREHGAGAAGLNATPDGLPLYRSRGYRQIGKGQTWFVPGGEGRSA